MKLVKHLILFVCLLTAVFVHIDKTFAEGNENPKLDSSVKNIILLIGDGMGPEHLGILATYAAVAPNSIYHNRQSYLEKAINQADLGYALVRDHHALVADSACAGTQIASGTSCNPESIGLDRHGEKAITVLEIAKQSGKSVGLITDTRITHATPAAFAIHTPTRHDENKIAEQLAESNVDIILGGGMRYWLPQEVNDPQSAAFALLSSQIGQRTQLNSKRNDSLNVIQIAEKNGFITAFDRHQLSKVAGSKVLGLFALSGMLDGIEYSRQRQQKDRLEPTLEEMTEFALAKLDQNPKGFFLAIEAGQIDWAAHANDAASLLHELIKIDQLVGYLLKSIEGRNDTLLIITADHATGLPGFAYSAYKIPQAKTIARKDGTKVAFSMRYNYGAPEILDKLYAQKTAFFRIAEKFKNLDPQEQNPKRLMQMVNSASAFKINIDQAKRVLATGQNPYLYPEHPDLSQTIVPKITDFPAFYPKPKGNLPVLIARELAEQQSFVWGTGTHSSTPTPVIAIGPRSITSQFKGIYTHVETGKFLRRALGK